MSPAGNERGSVAEVARTNERDDPVRVEHEEHPESFDPGIETGYLRRGARDHSLDPELGAAPFNPGPKRFDSRRSRRLARRREKAERKRRVKRQRQERERQATAERAELAQKEGLRRQRLHREREERERAGRARAERMRLQEEQHRARQLKLK